MNGPSKGEFDLATGFRNPSTTVSVPLQRGHGSPAIDHSTTGTLANIGPSSLVMSSTREADRVIAIGVGSPIL